MLKRQIVAMYRGDEFIDVGTKLELAKRYHISQSSISFMSSPTYHKRTQYTALHVYPVGYERFDGNDWKDYTPKKKATA